MWNFRNAAFAILLLPFAASHAQTLEQAGNVFRKTHEFCTPLDGNPCRTDLCAPWLLVDPGSRWTYSNHPLPFSHHPPVGGLYGGTLPPQYMISNGTLWIDSALFAMVMWNENMKVERLAEVAIHELTHYAQEKNGWHRLPYNNNHLETKWGRIYMILEMMALRNAILGKDPQEREKALYEALCFRRQRQRMFPDKKKDEESFEIHEGIPDYVMLQRCVSTDSLIRRRLVGKIDQLLESHNFLRSCGYVSGSAYAWLIQDDCLLKVAVEDGKPLPDILSEKMNINNIDNTLPDSVREGYGYSALLIQEDSLGKARQLLIREVERKLQEGARCAIPWTEDLHFGFNPSEACALDSLRSYYPTLAVSGTFGTLYSGSGGVVTAQEIIIFWDENNGSMQITLSSEWTIKKHENQYFIQKIDP